MTSNSSGQQHVRVIALVCLLAVIAIFGPVKLLASGLANSPKNAGVTTLWEPDDTGLPETSDEDWVLVLPPAGELPSGTIILQAGDSEEPRPFIVEKIGPSFLLNSNHLFCP